MTIPVIELSTVHKRMLTLLAEGRSCAEIGAAVLEYSEGYVQDFIWGLQSRLGARSREHLIALLFHYEVLRPEPRTDRLVYVNPKLRHQGPRRRVPAGHTGLADAEKMLLRGWSLGRVALAVGLHRTTLARRLDVPALQARAAELRQQREADLAKGNAPDTMLQTRLMRAANSP